jgi:hypothetical protein
METACELPPPARGVLIAVPQPRHPNDALRGIGTYFYQRRATKSGGLESWSTGIETNALVIMQEVYEERR